MQFRAYDPCMDIREAKSIFCSQPVRKCLIGLLAGLRCLSAGATDSPILANLSFDELSKIEIISVSRRGEKLSEAAAAVHVITGEDLRRSGVTSLPEALRLAPGVDVARINSQRHAVSVRGFNGEFANKFLVLQDGRSLYTPQFGGTFWDAQDVLFEDVERIEVVRGPGGTAWGVNAVNGVINILTKDARDTQGSLVTGGGGTSERGFGAVRQGGKLNEHTFYRVYAKAFYRGDTLLANGSDAGDDWSQARAGFRVDSHPNDADHLTVQGDFFGGELLQYTGGARDLFTTLGGNLMGRWGHAFSEESDVNVQVYYDAVRRDSKPATANTDTGDIEASHRFALGSRQQINWGLHYRYLVNEARGRIGHNYDPIRRGIQQASLFVEDQVTLVPERLRFSAGTKLEYNTFSEWDLLPNARLTFTPTARQTLWAAVSRGLQLPGIADRDLTIDAPGAVAFRSIPTRDRPLTELIAYEAGYRSRLAESLTLDLAAFYNEYDKLSTAESVRLALPPTVVVTPSNRMNGESYGVEGSVLWQAAEWWRWRANYSVLFLRLHLEPGTTDTASVRQEGQSPQQQFMLWSSMNLGNKWEFDSILRFVDSLPAFGIDQYMSLDLRLAFHPRPNLELAIVGQNLLDNQRLEFNRSPGFPARTEVARGVYGKVTWKF